MSSSGYDMVIVTLNGISHSARQDPRDRWIFTACGAPVYTGRAADIVTVHPLTSYSALNVDCMSCLVAEGRA